MDDKFPNDIDHDGPVILAGDATDDDGEVRDSMFLPGDPYGLPAKDLPTGPAPALTKPRPLTRLVTGTVTLRASQGAVQVLPPDPDRAELSLGVTVAATDGGTYLRVSDDPGKVQMDQGGAALFPAWIPPIHHTGAVFAQVPTGDGAKDYGMTVTYVAVTR